MHPPGPRTHGGWRLASAQLHGVGSQIRFAATPGAGCGIMAGVIDHVVLGVSDLPTSRAFYERALAPLGVRVVLDLDGYIGFGDRDKPWFFVATRAPSARVHLAFSAENRRLVEAFHAAALAAGGQDNGAPGLRPRYHPHYYGAFVLDPDGDNIEAVCHLPAAD